MGGPNAARPSPALPGEDETIVPDSTGIKYAVTRFEAEEFEISSMPFSSRAGHGRGLCVAAGLTERRAPTPPSRPDTNEGSRGRPGIKFG